MRTTLIALGAAAALALSACGSDVDTEAEDGGAAAEQPAESGETTGDTTAGTVDSDAETDLIFQIDDGSGAKSSHRLTCGPAGGSVMAAEAACAELSAAGEDVFAPVPKDQVCTQQFGGPETATVTGIYKGEEVTAEFNQTNGCEIARWSFIEAATGVGTENGTGEAGGESDGAADDADGAADGAADDSEGGE